MENVRDRDDAAEQIDFVMADAERIPATVHAFVMLKRDKRLPMACPDRLPVDLATSKIPLGLNKSRLIFWPITGCKCSSVLANISNPP